MEGSRAAKMMSSESGKSRAVKAASIAADIRGKLQALSGRRKQTEGPMIQELRLLQVLLGLRGARPITEMQTVMRGGLVMRRLTDAARRAWVRGMPEGTENPFPALNRTATEMKVALIVNRRKLASVVRKLVEASTGGEQAQTASPGASGMSGDEGDAEAETGEEDDDDGERERAVVEAAKAQVKTCLEALARSKRRTHVATVYTPLSIEEEDVLSAVFGGRREHRPAEVIAELLRPAATYKKVSVIAMRAWGRAHSGKPLVSGGKKDRVATTSAMLGAAGRMRIIAGRLINKRGQEGRQLEAGAEEASQDGESDGEAGQSVPPIPWDDGSGEEDEDGTSGDGYDSEWSAEREIGDDVHEGEASPAPSQGADGDDGDDDDDESGGDVEDAGHGDHDGDHDGPVDGEEEPEVAPGVWRLPGEDAHALHMGVWVKHGVGGKQWVRDQAEALRAKITFREARTRNKARAKEIARRRGSAKVELVVQGYESTEIMVAEAMGAGKPGGAGHATAGQAVGKSLRRADAEDKREYLKRHPFVGTRRVMQTLMSHGRVAQTKEGLVGQLREKHPDGPEIEDGDKTAVGLDLTAEDLGEIVDRCVDRMRLDAAIGPSGEDAKALQGIRDEMGDYLTTVMQRIARNDIDDELREALTACSIVGVPKPDGSMRPIALGGALGKLAGAVLKEVLKAKGMAKMPRQFLGEADGAAALVHAVTEAWSAGPDDSVVIQVDASNAFNEVSRQAVVDRIRDKAPQVLGLVLALYGRAGKLFYAADDGETYMIKSTTGVRQGDPAAMLLYAMTVQPVVDRVRARHPEVVILQMADDTTVVGPVEQATRAAQALAVELATVSLRLNEAKTEVLCKVGEKERVCESIARVNEDLGVGGEGEAPAVVQQDAVSDECAEVMRCVVAGGGVEQATVLGMTKVMKRISKDLEPGAGILTDEDMFDALGVKRSFHVISSSIANKFKFMERAVGIRMGDAFHVLLVATVAMLACHVLGVEIDVLQLACEDSMCQIGPEAFIAVMQMALDKMYPDGDDEGDRDKWWAMVGRKPGGLEPLFARATKATLARGGQKQKQLKRMMLRPTTAGGLGLPSVSELKLTALAGWTRAIKLMRKGEHDRPPETWGDPGADLEANEEDPDDQHEGEPGPGPGPAQAEPPDWEGLSLAHAAETGIGDSLSPAARNAAKILESLCKTSKDNKTAYEECRAKHEELLTQRKDVSKARDVVFAKGAPVCAEVVAELFEVQHSLVGHSAPQLPADVLSWLDNTITDRVAEMVAEQGGEGIGPGVDDEQHHADGLATRLRRRFNKQIQRRRSLAAVTGVAAGVPNCLGEMPQHVADKLRKHIHDSEIRQLGASTAPECHKFAVFWAKSLALKAEVDLISEYIWQRECADDKFRGERDQGMHADVATAPTDTEEPSVEAALARIYLHREHNLSYAQTWLQYSAQSGRQAMSDKAFLDNLFFRIGAHGADSLLEIEERIKCNCAEDGTSKRILQGGRSAVAAHLVRCQGSGGAMVAAHNRITQTLHDAAKAAGLDVEAEPKHWLDGKLIFGADQDGAPNKRPDLLIHLREGEAVLVDVTITSVVNKMLLRNSIKNPEEPLNHRFKAKTRQYAKSASTKDHMSAIVPFVVSAHGRLHTGGARLLDRIARRGFGTNLSAAGRWKSKWYARLVEATLTGTAWQLRGECDRLKGRVLKQRARAARANGADAA